MSWLRPLALSTSLALTLVACGGGGGGGGGEDGLTTSSENGNNAIPTDPLSVYKTQALNWAACEESAWQAATQMQCATFIAPLDYAGPEKGEITIEAKRIPAMSAQRKGAIFFNPGGPGANGLDEGLILLKRILGQQGGSQQVMTLQAQLVNGYDLVGFNPRGTGSKSPLICTSDTDQLSSDPTSTARNRPGNFEAMSANQQAIAQACQANPLTPYISTDATARDMDLLRHLMGDNKISYLGYSYGTWLGAWYGRLFPERVDRMVLDSNADVSADHMDFTEHQAIARDTLINDFLAPYAARHFATYDLGNTADAVQTHLAVLDPGIKKAYSTLIIMETYNNSATAKMTSALVAATGVDQLFKNMPGASDAQMRNSIEFHPFVPVNSTLTNYEARRAAHALWSKYQEIQSQATQIGQALAKTQLNSTGNNYGVLFSITCNDSAPPSRDLSYWKSLGDSIAQKAPFFGGGNPVTQTCMYWNTPSIQRPPLSALQGLDLLMVQSQYDGATPTPGAMKGFAALPKAHMVYVTDEYTHGVFPYNTDCVDVPVLQHLLGQTQNWRQKNCAASGAATPLDTAMTARSISSAESSSTSAEVQQRSELINKFKKHIGPSVTH